MNCAAPCPPSTLPPCVLYCTAPLYCPLQMLYRVYEPSELKPVLDAVNADMTKEKEAAK